MQRTRALLGLVLCAALAASCGDDGEGTDAPTPGPPDPGAPADYTERGPAEVSVTTTTLTDPNRGRTLPTEVWYPTEETLEAATVISFEAEPSRREVVGPLLEAAPTACVATTTGAARDGAATAGSYPVILYSHCYGCTRWSAHAVMERLASHGFVVVAPDHSGDTLVEAQAGALQPLDADLLAIRVADLRFVLEQVLAGDVLPDGVEPDTARIGLLGHSLGSVTVGAVAQDDPRIGAVAGLAAPMDNPLVPGVSIEAIEAPLALLVATEDNSVGEAGNIVARNNYAAANPPAYKIEIVDAGHWSVTNISGIDEAYAPGCGDGLRQQPPNEPFTYLSVERANDLTASFVTSFFAAHLNGDQAGLDILTSDPWPEEAPLEFRN